MFSVSCVSNVRWSVCNTFTVLHSVSAVRFVFCLLYTQTLVYMRSLSCFILKGSNRPVGEWILDLMNVELSNHQTLVLTRGRVVLHGLVSFLWSLAWLFNGGSSVRRLRVENLTLLWKYLSDSGEQAVASELNTTINKRRVQLWRDCLLLQQHLIEFPPSFLLSLFSPPLATLKASWRTMWNLIGWCTIGSLQGGTAKCPEPSLVTRLADKGRPWGVGPILSSQRMVQSPSGPCKGTLGFLLVFDTLFGPSLSSWFEKKRFF